MSPFQTQNRATMRLRPSERRNLLLFMDLLMAVLALLIALYYWSRADAIFDFSLSFVRQTPFWFPFLPVFWVILLVELYDIHRAANFQETFKGVAIAAMVGLGIYLLIYFTSEPKAMPRRGVAGFIVAASVLTLAWRVIYIRVFTAPQFMRRVLLVGGGETGTMILQVIKGLWPPPFFLVGVIDDDPQKIGKEIEACPVIGDSGQMMGLIAEQGISDLIVAISGQMQPKMFQALLEAQEAGIEITRMPVAYQELLGRIPIRYLEADWILRYFVDQARSSGLFEMTKRLLDILGGLAGTIVTLLLYPMIGLTIAIDSGFPILYKQVRLGRGGQQYNILKFRTMRQDAEKDGHPKWAEESDPRATRVGGFLRRTHLDELPQFFNVLRGEMSLVGPRAERPELVAMFQQKVPFYRARLLAKPGITGWAQVNFGYAANVDETMIKLEYDLYYIMNRNIFMDLLILLRTPATIFGLKGR